MAAKILLFSGVILVYTRKPRCQILQAACKVGLSLSMHLSIHLIDSVFPGLLCCQLLIDF